jgi:hypothetical protein
VIFTDLNEASCCRTPLGGIDQAAIVSVAFGEVEFAPDHFVACDHIAVDVDSLDVAARAVIKREDDVDDVGCGVAVGMGADIDERNSALAGRHRDRAGRLVDRLAVKDLALSEVDGLAQRRAVEVRNARQDMDRTEPVARAFIDGEGQAEALFSRIVGRGCRNMRIGKPVFQVETSQQVGIVLHAVRIVDVAGLEKGEPAGLGGVDDTLQARRSEFVIAEEGDALDAGLGAFLDLENKIDASVAAGHRGRLYLNLVAAVPVIGLDDACHILTHRRFGHCTARLKTDLVGEVLVLDLLIAFESHMLDHRRFNDGNDQAPAGPDDIHFVK